VSKFFYGGYALDGNLVYNGAKAHCHSNIARAIVESLTVARLVHNKNEDNHLHSVPTFNVTVKSRTEVNSSTQTI
jgi:hypothetical protein